MSKKNKAIKYPLYPTAEQKEYFAKNFGCCRKLWNLMLADKQECYKNTGSFGRQTPAQYKEAYPYLKEADSLALCNVQLSLERALKDHFNNPKHFNFPVFKSKPKSRKSYTTNNHGKTICIIGNQIRLPKIGLVKAKIHRLPPKNWVLKAATVSQDGDGKYYCAILFEYEDHVDSVLALEENTIGLDYKTNGLYADSYGELAEMPKYFKNASKRLSKSEQKLKRKTKGSKNYEKQKRRVAKKHKHVANQRKDFLHKKSTELAEQNDLVCIEDISIERQIHQRNNRGFHKSTMDNGWCTFTLLLEYKLQDRGKKLIKVDRFYPSSQICSSCGAVNPALADEHIREWICPVCGSKHDRDINAAKNIKKEGFRIYRESLDSDTLLGKEEPEQ